MYVGFMGVPTLSLAQKRPNRAKLEAEKKENLARISELNAIIEKTEQKKEASVGRLNAIGERINKQVKQIDILSQNQDLLSVEVDEINKTKDNLTGDLTKLKAEYGKMIYHAAKVSNKYNQLTFLFSASTFNQLVRRYRYLRQYSDQRRKQATMIEQIREELMAEQVKLLQKKQEQAAILQDKIKETHSLEMLKTKQSSVVEALSSKEQKLRQQLEDNRRAVERLEDMIAKIVEKEIRKSRTKQTAVNVAPNEIELSPDEAKVASSFTALKGRMPWPVKSGFISGHFGIQPHPFLKKIRVNNNGVDIQTSAGNSVLAVYKGIVQRVVNIQGVNTMVAVQHGDYFTVYSKLDNVTVQEGQVVALGQKIGEVATDADGTSEVNFQVWKNASKQNPELWLKAR